MYGPEILARFLSVPSSTADKWGNYWQYNSRSDRHSKVACWGVAFDLMLTSSLLRTHAAADKIVLGVNQEMVDFATQRKKDLDLVIARSATSTETRRESLADLVDRYGILLTEEERALLGQLPRLPIATVPSTSTLIALEAKACMTAHVKSLPRLYDELNSSHLCVHGAARQALAIAFVQVNASERFVSSVTNNYSLAERAPVWSEHRQPQDTNRVLDKISEMPRRSATSEVGFDGLGVVVLDARNDGSPVRIVSGPPAPPPSSTFDYAGMIVRMATVYDATFGHL